MFKSGAFVADHLEPVRSEQIQPNGVDLTLDTVFEQVSAGEIRQDGKTIGDRRECERSGEVYDLQPGGYIVRYGEQIHIPENHIGFLYPRSSLLRNSCMLDTAVWDAGYRGRGEGLLEVYHRIEIEPGARIAQLVFASADHVGEYDGSYQNENI